MCLDMFSKKKNSELAVISRRLHTSECSEIPMTCFDLPKNYVSKGVHK